ncbi:MAG TPA: cupin domain-containing protein, partial [Methylomirabilota bacterium]|nr:cupin domain-containing protein [Methylomirabilota bacterium]
MLTPEGFSAMHRLASDEIFHFYLGDPVEMLQLWSDGSH